jgi:DNA processing protein
MWNPEDRQAIAVVGTRYTSGYGRQTTERLTSALCEQPLTIVSGMARGVDTVAHRTALEKGARTIAALGSGLDKPYPYENRALMEAIAEQGAVVSEQPLGTDPDAMNFPQRNRIISGMSLGVLVIEAGEKSGALITARYALEHNREVFAVPGPLTSETSVGTNRLIKEGTAKLIQNVGDILVELPGSLRLPAPEAPVQEPPPSLSPEERRVYDLLGATPLHIDRIAALLEMTTSRALGLLLALELKEGARQLPGKQFVKG